MLEEYNKELHENLLQTVACIENMETELQCTKAELVSCKEKYRRSAFKLYMLCYHEKQTFLHVVLKNDNTPLSLFV